MKLSWGWTWWGASRQHARRARPDGGLASITLCGMQPRWYSFQWWRHEEMPRCGRCRIVAARDEAAQA